MDKCTNVYVFANTHSVENSYEQYLHPSMLMHLHTQGHSACTHAHRWTQMKKTITRMYVGRPRVLSSRIHSSPEKSMDELTAHSNTGLCGNNTNTHFMHM